MGKTHVLLVFIFALTVYASGQNLPVIRPEILSPNLYSKSEQVKWEKSLEQYAKLNEGELTVPLSEADQERIDSLEMGYGPLTQGPGCSWYCGGGPYRITSTSNLAKQGNLSYSPENIHDFDLFTAWVPDHRSGNTGQKISFHFKPFSPRVNEILIWNGYIKNTDLWKANARAAKLKLIVNGNPIAILELQDVHHTQSFKIGPQQSTDSTKDLVLTLEIMETYKGEKYNDVAISEVNFKGLDVHCFGAGTQITMANFSYKNIELIVSGDWVMTYDEEKKELTPDQVSSLVKARHSQLNRLSFSGGEIICTDDHPFRTADHQWASVNPAKSNSDYVQETEVRQLVIGDMIFVPQGNRYTALTGMEMLPGERLTYTLELKSADNFIAGGLLVKTEKPRQVNMAHRE